MTKHCHYLQILTDNATRASYDYALAHPKEHLYNQYRYYRNRAYREMKVPAQYTITGLIVLWSMLQYFTKRMMYDDVRSLPPNLPHVCQEKSAAHSSSSPCITCCITGMTDLLPADMI